MRIHKLNSLVAQRIAAGEVIERPASVVRELIDNSIDAKATSITLRIKAGGLEEITIIDDGGGINKEDLLICSDSHTTSKVSTLDDLYHLQSLGFRGEALYSIAAVSVLTISSSYQGTSPSSITIDNGVQSPILPKGPTKGTIINVEDLFAEIPARRQFLKRPATEATMCKNVLIEKSLAFENIEFRYYNNDKLTLHLPATNRKDRILSALSTPKIKLLSNDTMILKTQQERFSIFSIAGKPNLKRSDRSQIKIYINNRPITNYALVQAVTFGYGELLPGGSFPYCYIFIQVDPTLVDFNIHPAKKEAKLRIQSEIHHSIVMMIKNQMEREIPTFQPNMVQEELDLQSLGEENINFNNQRGNTSFDTEKKTNYFTHMANTNYSTNNLNSRSSLEDKIPTDPKWFEKAKKILSNDEKERTVQPPVITDEPFNEIVSPNFTYIGQAFNLFLIVEKENELFLIDQHAAHERILFDKIKKRQSIQNLLIPVAFEVERDVDEYLILNSDVYANLGINLSRKEDLLWQINSIPTVYKNIENKIVNYIQINTGDLDSIETGLFAILACHSAIRQGDKIDPKTAISIIDEVFKMSEPCCPHGRTFLIRLEKDELCKVVGRT